jgi:RNA polymerase sigma factor (sigma-70 family)
MNASLRPTYCTSPDLLQGHVAPAQYLRVTHSDVRTGVSERTKPTCMSVVDAPSTEPLERTAPPVLDVEAYNRVVDDHSDALYRYVVKHLRDRDEAKDIVQECFLRLWMRLDHVAASGVRSYLFTTAHNLVVDRTRRRKRLDRYDAGHEHVLTTQQPKAGLGEAIDRALAHLTPLQRSLILLRDREGHSCQHVATITGLEMTQVKVYLFRARKAMQAQLGSLEQWV